jgi:hypothetical protein
MSWHASSWASWYSESRLSDRLVIFVIAHHVSDEGEARISINTICKETRLGRSTAIDSIYSLVRMGELAVRRGGKFRGDSNSYSLPKFNLWVQSVAPKAKPKESDKRLLRVQPTRHRIVEELNIKPKTRASRESRNSFDEALEQKRRIEARNRRETKEDEAHREANIGDAGRYL